MTQDSIPSVGSEPIPWWRTVSTKELATSSGLVSDLLNSAQHHTGSGPTALARALVIQQLFEQETVLGDLLVEAKERSEMYSQVDETSDLTEARSWLAHCALLLDVFGQSIEMLGSDWRGERSVPFREFVMRVAMLRARLIDVEMSKGVGKGIPAPPPVRFRRRDPL